MLAALLLIAVGCVIWISRRVVGYWINPVSVYLTVWSIAASASYLNWLNLYPISGWAWTIMLMSSAAFAIGGLTVALASRRPTEKRVTREVDSEWSADTERLVRKAILVLCAAALVAVLYDWFQLLRTYGSVSNIILSSNTIYVNRITGVSSASSIPYLSSFALCASALAGVAIAKMRKWKLIYLLPLVVVAMDSVAAMGRTGILMALGLYVFPSFMIRGTEIRRRLPSLRRLVYVPLLLAVFAGTNLLRDARGGIENYELPDSAVLTALESMGLFRPSLYMYVAGPPVSFSESLDHDRESLGKGEVPGMQTFAPIFRVLSRADIIDRVSYYEEFVALGTSRSMNVGTYLKDVYIDFGELGCVAFAYLFGILSMWIFHRATQRHSLSWIGLAMFILVYITLSPQTNLMRLGYFVIPSVSMWIIGLSLDRKLARRG